MEPGGLVAAGLLAVATLLAGCVAPAPERQEPPPSPPGEPEERGDVGAPSESAWTEADVVEVVDSAFQPSRAKVPHGASLTFTNRGEGVHTVTLQREGAFTFLEDRNLYPGEAVEVNFTEPGIYLLRCKVHSPDFEQGMVGRVMVD